MGITKHDLTLELECIVHELSPAQMASYEKVANEHNAVKNSLKRALTNNEGKEIFNGDVFQAYSFKGKVLQELKEATVPKKTTPKPVEPADTASSRANRKRPSNLVYLDSSDDADEDIPLAKRMQNTKKASTSTPVARKLLAATPTPKKGSSGKFSPLPTKSPAITEKSPSTAGFRPSELSSVGGLVVGSAKEKDNKNEKDAKLQGKTFPSLVVLAKPWLKVRDMSITRSKLDSKVKLVLMLTANKFTEWLLQEGLLKAEQRCTYHKNKELKLGVYSDASKFPYTGGYVWISECCPTRFVSVFHGSMFEGAAHPPSCILKLIYHWSCQTNIQNVVQWVKVDNVYIKGVYTWLRAVCTLGVHQKMKKLGGPDKYVEVGVISLGTTSQDGAQRQVKVEVLGILDHADKVVRLRAVDPISDVDRNYKKRFQTILEPLQRWVHRDSIVCIDLTVDKVTLHQMGFKYVVQAAATDTTAKHTNAMVMDYLRRIVPRMFQNTLSLLSRQMIQQFLDELVWREQFGTYALQAFNNITSHIAEQTRLNTSETLTQRLYQVATNPFKDWSILPANCRATPANTVPKRLKNPINESDYLPQPPRSVEVRKDKVKSIAPESTSGKSTVRPQRSVTQQQQQRYSLSLSPSPPPSTPPPPSQTKPQSKLVEIKSKASKQATPKTPAVAPSSQKSVNKKVDFKTPLKQQKPIKTPLRYDKKFTLTAKATPKNNNKSNYKKHTTAAVYKQQEEEDMKGLEELYYGVRDGQDECFESYPYNEDDGAYSAPLICTICHTEEHFSSNVELQKHLCTHINMSGSSVGNKQCIYCLEKFTSQKLLEEHQEHAHPTLTRGDSKTRTFNCLFCQTALNNLTQLTTHLFKVHNLLELPYACQACGYQTSTHHDMIRHFNDDHHQHNFLLCPFCLDIAHFSHKGDLNIDHIEQFIAHLHKHALKKQNKCELKCNRCVLSFLDNGGLKMHGYNHHVGLYKSAESVRPLLQSGLMIVPPKVRNHHREPLNFSVAEKVDQFFAFIESSVCAECNCEIVNERHFPSLMKCNKCSYKSNCERAMFSHANNCKGETESRYILELPWEKDMYCVCGFVTSIGNKMAEHMAKCRQPSCYSTMAAAQDNTVQQSMLDSLGLKPNESSTENTAVDDGKPSQDGQEPIPFGEMEAQPIGDDLVSTASDQFTALTNVGSMPIEVDVGQFQTQLEDFAVPQHNLGAADGIDMPLIEALNDANTTTENEHYLGEVHTPMFDAITAADQQDFNQLIQHNGQ